MTPATPRTQVLNLAILGFLSEGEQHGYALRKALNLSLGTFRTLSYGSLYPALRRLETSGYIVSREIPPAPGALRKKITYTITDQGKEYLDNELSSVGPGDWEDGTFDVRFQMFGSTDSTTRLRILEGRYTRMLERREALQLWADIAYKQGDPYAVELSRHGLEQVLAEVRWIEEMIEKERRLKSERQAKQ